MTEHNSARRRPRVPRGRHAAAPRSRRASEDSARSARAHAFGDAAETTDVDDAWADASTAPAVEAEDGDGADEATAAAGPRGRRRAEATPGSLPRAAGWTVLTTILPGTGLISTRMRVLGWILLAVLVLGVGGLVAWVTLGDPLPTLLHLVSSRNVVIGILVAVIVVGLVWMLQILLSNVAHNTKERLHGPRRVVSLVLALVLMAGVATPFAMGAQRVYAAQGLLGNTSVFGGTDDGRIGGGADPWASTERINVMLLGQDAGADRTGTRPDTIMVASIDTKTGRTALFSLPRNLQYVRFPKGSVEAKQFPEGFDAFGKDENLINAVWTWADDNKDLYPGDDNPGLTATTHAVEQTTGLSMDYYAMVDLQGFEDLVNAIGGVDMNVERRIPIGGGINQATGGKYPITGWIEPGYQHLDGYHALWYARSREGSDDYNRMCRQQRMVRVVSEEADPTTLALAFPKLVTATENNIQTDIPPGRIDAFVTLALRVKDAGFQSYPLTRDIDAPGEDNWGKYGHPNWDYIHQWVQDSIADSMTSTTAVSVKGEDTTAAPAPETSAPEESTAPAEEEPTTEAPPAEADDPTADATADPLQSCMPGGE